MNILLVEDDLNATELASYILEAAGHEVTVAATAAEALRLDVTGYELVVVDLGLPDVDGVDLVRAIRARGGRSGILVCSAYAGDLHRRDAREAGCDVFLAKPFRRQQLLEAVDMARQAAVIRA